MLHKPLAWLFGLIMLIGLGLGTNTQYQKVVEVKKILGEGATRVGESIRANGCVTENTVANIAQYLRSNGLDPSRVYFNASSRPAGLRFHVRERCFGLRLSY